MHISRWTCRALGLVLVITAGAAAEDVRDYVQRPDAAYTWKVTADQPFINGQMQQIRMTSQTWRGKAWWHWMVVAIPREVDADKPAILIISGGSNRPNDAPQYDQQRMAFLQATAVMTGVPIAIVGQVPNQPLEDGLTEDELLAYTLDKYLEGKGDDWPLLLPMTKAAVRAMDTVQATIETQRKVKLKSFIVTGASKRGWTTWLTAAADDRVKAIVPMVIDTLNIQEQVPYQLKSIGEYRPATCDYIKLRIFERMASPKGRQLFSVIDPYAYRKQLDMPKFIVLGANDPFWTTDASSLYYDGLPGPTYLYYAPNCGHQPSRDALVATQAFMLAIIKNEKLPKLTWSHEADGTMVVTCDPADSRATLWQAHSETRDFLKSPWRPSPINGQSPWRVKVDKPASGYTAYYVTVQCRNESSYLPTNASTTITITPDTFPFAERKP